MYTFTLMHIPQASLLLGYYKIKSEGLANHLRASANKVLSKLNYDFQSSPGCMPNYVLHVNDYIRRISVNDDTNFIVEAETGVPQQRG